MTVVLPSHLTYGKVVARWIKAIGDTPEDPDKLPEAIAVQGKVIIVPKNKANVTLDNEGFASTYVGVAYERSEYQLNELGQITDPHGDVGVWLIAGYYTIECQFTNGSWPSFDFEVTAEHTDLAPLDLMTVSPTQPITGLQMVVNEAMALRAEAAALEAEAIAATIPEFHVGDTPPEDPDVFWLDIRPTTDFSVTSVDGQTGDISLTSTYAPARTGAPATVPAMPRPTWLTTFQPGHGWTAIIGTLTDDTTDHIYGTQSVRVSGTTPAIQHTETIDLTGKALVLRARINSMATAASFMVYAGAAGGYTTFARWAITSGSNSAPWFREGEWVTITLPWESAELVGAPARNSITGLRIRMLNGDGDFNAQAIGTIPVTSRTGSVSFTFDDGYDSVLTAARIMGSRGIAGTAFIIPSAIGLGDRLTVTDCHTLINTYGWDIQAHGSTVYTTMTADQMRAEWIATRAWFAANGLGRPDHLAYVGGQNDEMVASTAREFFTTARTIGQFTLPHETWPPPMPLRLRAISSVGSAAAGREVAVVTALIDKAVVGGHHLNLCFHKISDGVPDPDDGMSCSAADLATICDHVVSTGAVAPTIAGLVSQ